MALPKFPEEFIQKAIQYIDENGIPDQNRSTKYELISKPSIMSTTKHKTPHCCRA